MAQVSVGDLAQSFLFRKQTVTIKSDLQRLTTELSTGVVSDTTAQLSGDLAPLSGIDTSLSRLKAYSSVTKEAALLTGVMQTALAQIDQQASTSSRALIAAASSQSTDKINSAGTDARRQFDTMVSTLNSRFGDQTLFAGKATSGPAVAASDSILNALVAATSSAQTVADVETAVTSWFSDPSGYAANGYAGGPPLESWNIAPGESANAEFTAMDPGIRNTLASLAMAALLDRGVLGADPDARKDLAQRAGVKLLETQGGRTLMASRLGTVEGQIENASTRNSAEKSSLEIARNSLIAADPYDTAAKLEETQTQLETMYAVIARLARLSLVDFLR